MPINDAVIRSRIDPVVKRRANRVLHNMGLTMSDAIRLFLHQVIVKEALPFEVKTPNATTVAAMEAVDRGEGLREVTLEQLRKEWDDA